MDHLLRFQRSMHVKLTPVVRNGGQIQPLESVIMILVKKPGDLVRQEGNNVVFSQFASIPMQNAFVPEGIVAVYAPTLQIMLQMSACLGALPDIHSDAHAWPMGIRTFLTSTSISLPPAIST